jgi:hypothetical protein
MEAGIDKGKTYSSLPRRRILRGRIRSLRAARLTTMVLLRLIPRGPTVIDPVGTRDPPTREPVAVIAPPEVVAMPEPGIAAGPLPQLEAA